MATCRKYPFVPGHEAIGTVRAVGRDAKTVTVGQTVGLGWNSEQLYVRARSAWPAITICAATWNRPSSARHGAFATRVRCHWSWATPIPAGVDLAVAGPLLCGGITVFNPLIQHDVSPTHKVGVIGIGGLGHMALQFAQ